MKNTGCLVQLSYKFQRLRFSIQIIHFRYLDFMMLHKILKSSEFENNFQNRLKHKNFHHFSRWLNTLKNNLKGYIVPSQATILFRREEDKWMENLRLHIDQILWQESSCSCEIFSKGSVISCDYFIALKRSK